MKTQYTAIVERDRGWYVVHCVEIPGASGRGPTLEAAKESLAEAIVLLLERDDGEAAQEPTGDMLH
ncbi:MAG: type II toxin-antitoxin system HicB family antitoxin [Proteobacteria bacterium]|nr:type II toxin-antitoxin system HicB family antitoxin [Pseudomonadota bacterium]